MNTKKNKSPLFGMMLLAAAMLFAAGCKKNEPIEVSGTYKGHDYVDLGLPSGTLWATCNVGANSPEEYGDYIAWGETSVKPRYDWENYKYCNGVKDQLTKYCSDSVWGQNGFTDALSILQPDDDAATANWGEGWNMPTKEQWEELEQHTTYTRTKYNGVEGFLFTASNGRGVFFPNAGIFSGGYVSSDTNFGFYWSSSLRIEHPFHAWHYHFIDDYFEEDCLDKRGNRDEGLSVRPVCSASRN